MSAEANHGRFVWFDLMTIDPPAAVDFYTRLVGWGTQEWTGLDTPYTMWANGETPLGGVVPLPPEARANGAAPHWLAYVAVADVDRTAGRAMELGGTVRQLHRLLHEVDREALVGKRESSSHSRNTAADDEAGGRDPHGFAFERFLET